jgi:type II secretory pathway component PulF
MSSLPNTFAYRAQGIDGQPLSGTVDAASADHARERLESLRLRVLELAPAADPARSARPLRGEDFLTFNQQLAHLTAAGMPLEHGLRLIAEDLRRGRVADTVRQIADDLEKGVPLGAAFEKHASQFPPAYGHLVDAGVKTNNLSGMLLNLGEHLRTLAQLRAALWRALAYPLVVFIALCCIVAFLSGYLFPRFSDVYQMWGTQLPAVTEFLIHHGRAIAVFFLALAVLVVAALLVARVLKAAGKHGPLRDAVGLRLPLVGPVLSRSLVSRWCDAVRLGVVGGMDLPQAMRTAGDAVGSNRIRADADRMAAKLEAGQPILAGESFDVLPATVPAAIDLSTRHGGLPQTLGTLAHMYREQAQAKVGVIPAVLTPLLLTLLTCAIGFIILAMFLPFVTLINALSGGGK